MIRALVLLTNSREFQIVDEKDLPGLAQFDVMWLDISNGEDTKVEPLLRSFGIDRNLLVRDDGDYFRSVDEQERSIHLVFNAPETGRGRLVIDRIDVILEERLLVTEHDDPVPALDRLWNPEILEKHGIGSTASLLALFSRASGRQIVPLLEELETRIDGLEDLAFEADPRTLTEAHALRRELITLRRIVGRQRDVMEYLATSVHAVVAADQKPFQIAAENARRLADSLEAARVLLASVLETHRGAVADQTNEIVRLLTVFSAILLPLTLLAGIFGMNFSFIPTSGESWGFWVWIGAMVAIAVGLWLYFGRRGFVGRPRLTELPKAVGLGLFQVGTAPVRALASGVGTTLQHIDRLISTPEEPDDTNE